MVLKIVRNTTKNDPEDRDKEKAMPTRKPGSLIKKVIKKVKQRRSVTGKKGSRIKDVVKTKGGNYPVHAKKSKSAKSFRKTYAQARKDAMKGGKQTFTWNGRKYSTDKKMTTKKGASYSNKAGKGVKTRLTNAGRRMKANAAARRKKRTTRRTNRKKK